jgi:hypothetical protein
LRHRLSNARLNRAKFQSVKSLGVLLGEPNERLGPCYLNSSFILYKDSVFREAPDILTLFQRSIQSVEVMIQCNQLKQLSTSHAWLDLIIVDFASFVVHLLNLTVLHRDPVNFLGECGIWVHHGLLNVFDEALMHLVSSRRLVVSIRELNLEVMPLLTLGVNL